MSLYGAKPIDSIEKIGNSNEILEAFFVDDILKMSSEEIHEFCKSEEAKILVEKAVLVHQDVYVALIVSEKNGLVQKVFKGAFE